jgi:hypothetical protein
MGARDDFDNFAGRDLAGSAGCGLVTLERYAEMTGLPLQVCLGHVNKGLLPCVTIGRRRLVNVVALQRELAKKPFVLN